MCYDPTTNKVFVSRHVKFLDFDFPYSTLANSSSSPVTESHSFSIPLALCDLSMSQIIHTIPSPTAPVLSSSPTSSNSDYQSFLPPSSTVSTLAAVPLSSSSSNSQSNSDRKSVV